MDVSYQVIQIVRVRSDLMSEWIHQNLRVRMEGEERGDAVSLNEVPNCSCLWLRECVSSLVDFRARISRRANLTEEPVKISVQINSLAASSRGWLEEACKQNILNFFRNATYPSPAVCTSEVTYSCATAGFPDHCCCDCIRIHLG